MIRALDVERVSQLVVHTGQHHDYLMSEIFFRDLDMAPPSVALPPASGSHAHQLARLMIGLERELKRLSPQLVIVYGDVNSTLAGALVATQLALPIAHVEAGLRSFDMTMPEEINRRIADSLSEILFTTTQEACENLAREGLDSVETHFVGNSMIDSLVANLERLDPAGVIDRLSISVPYAVATLHRPSNIDRSADAAEVVEALAAVASQLTVVVPLHPRGARIMAKAGLTKIPNVKVLPPAGYVEFLSLIRGASIVITDSGGVQEETTVLGVPCLTLRPNTERPITVTHGTNRLVTREGLSDAVRSTLLGPPRVTGHPALWDGHAGERIAAVIKEWLDRDS